MFNKNPENVEKAAKSPVREIIEWILVVVIAVAAAYVIRKYFFQMVVVDGQSMDYTLADGDRLCVLSFNYTPDNGDIVVFNPYGDRTHPYIKRVIATEEQSIYIDDKGSVFVDGKKLTEDYLGTHTDRGIGFYATPEGEPVKIPENDSAVIRATAEKPYIVPDGYVFAMGDNRAHSHDCRDIGPVKKEDVVGKAVFRVYPFNNFGFLS